MRSLIITCLAFAALPLAAGPVELGSVKWSRDYDASLEKVKKSGKPMFLLFQEVPG